MAFFFSHLWVICAPGIKSNMTFLSNESLGYHIELPEKFPFEQLYPNDCKHELQEQCDQHNVANGLYSYNHTLKKEFRSFSFVCM